MNNNNSLAIFAFAILALVVAVGAFIYVGKHHDHTCPPPQIIRETIQMPSQQQPIQQPQFQPSNSAMNRQFYMEGYEDGFSCRRPCYPTNYYYMRGYHNGKSHHDTHQHHNPSIGLDIHIN